MVWPSQAEEMYCFDMVLWQACLQLYPFSGHDSLDSLRVDRG